MDIDIGEDNHHFQDELDIINKGKKYERHFGKEENCPICVALQMKNKLLEEKNTLPILNNKYHKIIEHQTINQSPIKNNGLSSKSKEKINRIMSCKPEYIRKRNMRRNESAKEIMNVDSINLLNNEAELINKKDINEKFPCLKGYFNNNKYN